MGIRERWIRMVGLLILVLGGQGIAQDQARALRYFKLLCQRPSGDYLYDRFYDAWLDANSVESLEDFLKQSETQQPDANHQLLLSFFYQRQGNDGQALACLDQALDQEPNRPDMLLLRAQAETRLRRFDRAIEDLTALEKLDLKPKDRIEAGQMLARLYVRTLKPELARATWQRLLQTFPDDEDLYEELIELQWNEGLYDDALATSEALIERTDDPYLKVMRVLRKGDIQWVKGLKEEALATYSGTLAWVGQGTWLENQICSQIAEVFRREDDTVGLQEIWKSLSERYPQRLGLQERYAQSLLQNGEHEQAVGLYRQMVSTAPGNMEVQQALIEALIQTDQVDRAITLLGQLQEQHPQNLELLLQTAQLQARQQQPDQAAATLNRYLERCDRSEANMLKVARLLERYHCIDQAFVVYTSLLQAYPDSLTAREAYADCLARHDRSDEALQQWQTLAHAGDLSMLLKMVQTANLHDHSQEALTWLEQQYDRYHTEPGFLDALNQQALRCEAYERAVPWLLEQVNQATRFTALQEACRHVLTLVRQEDASDAWIKRLRQAQRTVQETCLLAQLLAMQNRMDDAFQAIEESQSQQPTLILQQKIGLYQQQCRWEAAADCTRELMDILGTQDIYTLKQIIDLYQRAGLLEQALQWIPAWKRLAPGNAEVWRTQAALLKSLGRYQDAVSTLRHANTVLDGDTTILTQLSQLYRETGQWSQACRVTWHLYEEAQNISDKLRWVRQLAQDMIRQNQTETLIEQFEQRHRSNRSSVVPCLALAEIYRQLGQYEQRRQALMEATRLRPKDVSLLQEIAQIEETEGDWEQALETLKQAAVLDTTDQTRQRMARLQIQYGNEQEGYRLLFDQGDHPITDPRELEKILLMMAQNQDWDLVIDFLQPHLSQFPQDYRLHYLYAVALEEDGRDKEALQYFLKVMDMDEEIPGQTGQTPAAVSTYQNFVSGQVIPPILWQFSQTVDALYRVYRTQSLRVRGYSWHGMVTNRQVVLPERVERVPGYCLAHLVTLAQRSTPADRQELQQQLEFHGYQDSEVLLALGRWPGEQLYNHLQELQQAYPTNKILLGLLLMYRGRGSLQEVDPELVRQVYKDYQQTYPVFSRTLALSFGAVHPDVNDLITDAIAQLQTLDQADYYTMSRVAEVLMQEDSQLTGPQQTILRQQFKKWCERIPAQHPYRFQMIQLWLRTLARNQEIKSLVKALDQEFEMAEQTTSAVSSRYYLGRSGYSGGELIKPLDCPPLNLIQSPQTRLALEIFHPNNSQYYYNSSVNFSTDQFKQACQWAQHPVLRALLAMVTEDEPNAVSSLESLLQKHPNESESRVLLASILGKQGREVEAMAQLVTLLATPWGQSHRDELQGALVAYGLGLDPAVQTEAAQWTREAAADLAYRTSTTNQQRETLIRVLDKMGMEEELQDLLQRKMAQNQQTLQIQQRVALQRYGMVGRTATPLSRIEELLQKDKTDTALHLVLRNLKSSNSGGGSLSRSDFQRLVGLIQSYHLEDRLLQMSHPGESRNPSRWLFYGRLCQTLGRQEQAGQVYAEILRQHPRHRETRLQMIDYLFEKGDPNAVVTHLLGLEPQEQSIAGEMLAGYSDYRGNSDLAEMERMLGIAQMALHYLQLLPYPNHVDLNWITRVIRNLAQDRYLSNDVRFYALNQGPNTELSDENQALDQQRFDLHQSLCRAMIPIPALAQEGFIQLYNAARAWQVDESQVKELAWQTWRVTQSRTSYSSTQSSWGMGRDSRSLAPVEVLMHEAWRQGHLSSCTEKLLDTGRPEDRETLSKQLNLLSDLYQADANGFAAAAEALVSDWPRNRQVPGMTFFTSPNFRKHYILEVYAERDLNADLDDLVVQWCPQTADYSRFSMGVPLYLTTIARHRSPDAIKALLESILSAYLGPKEQWPQRLAQQDRSSMRGYPGGDNLTSRQAFEVLSQAAEQRTLFWPVVEVAQAMGPINRSLESRINSTLYEIIQQMQYSQQRPEAQERNARMAVIARIVQRRGGGSVRSLQDVTPVDPNVGREFLEDAPFMGDLPSFDPVILEGYENGSVLGYLAQQFDWSRVYDPNSETFGEAFLASLSKQDDSATVYQCLGRFWGEFQELSASQQQAIVLVIKAGRNVASIPLGDLPTETARQAYQWIVAQRNDSYKDQVTSFLAVKRIEDLPIESSRFQDYVRTLLWNVAPHDIPAGKAILLKAQTLSERARLLGGSRYYFGNEDIIEGILSNYSGGESFLPRLGLLVALVRDANEPVYLPGQQLLSNMTYGTNDFMRPLRQQFPDGDLALLKAAFNQMGPYMGSGDVTPVIPVIAEILQRYGNGRQGEVDWDACLAFFQAQQTQGDYPGLARAFLLQARFEHERRQPRRERGDNDEPPSELLDYLQHHFSNRSLPVAWRLMSLYSLTQRRSFTFNQSEFLVPLTDLIVQAMRTYKTVPATYCRGWLGQLLYMPHDETWIEQAKILTQAYAEAMQAPVDSRRGSSLRSSDHILLEINLILNQEDRARQLILRQDSDLGRSQDCWVLLQRYHQSDLLAWVAQQYWENVTDNLGTYIRSQSNESMPDLQDDLNAIEQDDLRYFTEIVLTSRYAELANESPKAVEAMAALAEHFRSMEFSSPSLKLRSLLFLTRDNQSLPYLTEELSQTTAVITPTLLVSTTQDSLRQMQSELLAAYGMERILQGDPNQFVTTVEGLAQLNQEQSRYQAEQCLERFQQGWDRLHRLIADLKWTPTQIKAMAQAGRTLVLARLPRRYFNDQTLARLLIYHILGGQEEAFTTFYQALPKNTQRARISTINEYQLLQALKELIPRDHYSLEERIAAIKLVLANDMAWQTLTQNTQRDDLLEKLRNRGLLRREEIEGHPELVTSLTGPDTRIEAFLSTEYFSDLKLPVAAFLDAYVLDLLAQPAAQDVNTAVALLFKAASWAPEARSVHRWQDGSDRDPMTYLLEQKVPKSLADISIFMQLGNRPDDSRLIVPTRYMERIRDLLSRQFSQIRRSQGPNDLQAIQILIEQLQPYTQGCDTAGLLPCLEPMGWEFNQKERIEPILSWLETQIQEHPQESLYQDLLVTFAYRAKARDVIENEVYTRYCNMIGDPNLSLPWKQLAIPQYSLNDDRGLCQAKWVKPAIPLILQCWQRHLPLDGLHTVLSGIARLECDDTWFPVATKISDAFFEEQPVDLTYTDWRSLNKIHIKAGWMEKSEKIMDLYPALKDDLGVWSYLLQYERYSSLLPLIGPRPLSFHRESSCPFDRQLHDKVTVFLTMIEPTDLRYYTEAQFSRLPDTINEKDRYERSSDERLINLVQRYGEIEFSSDSLRECTLWALTRSSATLPLLALELARVVQPLDWTSYIQTDKDLHRDLQLDLWQTHAKAQLMLADPNVLIAGIRAFEQAYWTLYPHGDRSPDHPRQRQCRDLYRQFLNCVIQTAQFVRTQWTVEQMDALAQCVDTYLQQQELRNELGLRIDYADLFYETHLYAGHTADEIEASLTQLPESNAKEIRQLLTWAQNLSGFLKRFGEYLHDRQLPVERRLSIVNTFSHLNPVQDAISQSGDTAFLLYEFNQGQILTADEIREHAEGLQSWPGCDVTQWTPDHRPVREESRPALRQAPASLRGGRR